MLKRWKEWKTILINEILKNFNNYDILTMVNNMKVVRYRLLKFLFLIIFMFICVIDVNASTGTLRKSENKYVYKNGTFTTTDVDEDNSIYYKDNTSGTSYISYTSLSGASVENGTCTTSTLSQNESLALAYIINKVTGVEGGIANMSSNKTKYYWTELAALKYLNHTQGLTLDSNVFNTQIQSITSSRENMTTLINSANNYATKYSKPINLTLSENKLEFELLGDYYYSQKIYIRDNNSNIDSTKISVDNSNFAIEEGTDNNGKYFKVKVSKSNISGKSGNVNVTIQATNKYYVAKFYDCTSGYNDLLATSTILKTSSATSTTSGSLSVTKLVINNVDKEGNYLNGAKIKIESTDGKYQNVVLTQDKSIVLENIPYGKYKITEISAPNKYITNKEAINIELSESKLSEEVKITNQLTRVEISKIDGKNGKILEGVKLQLQAKDGKIFYEWESTNEKYIIEGLPYGKYYVVELSVPEGYELNKERIEFEVDDITDVVSVKVANDQNVNVPDTFSTGSAIILLVSMIFISVGIVVILFVKRNKLIK